MFFHYNVVVYPHFIPQIRERRAVLDEDRYTRSVKNDPLYTEHLSFPTLSCRTTPALLSSCSFTLFNTSSTCHVRISEGGGG